MKIMFPTVTIGVVFLLAVTVCVANPLPPGTFQTTCHERHFWLSVKSSFLGSMIRFDFEDPYGFHHLLSEQEATLCGYTVLIDDVGDLTFRASFLACHVHSRKGTDYFLRLWFVNSQTDGTVVVYPFQLRCSILWPWGTREIICEENYMEVSIQQPVLPVESKTQTRKADVAQLAVMIHRAGQLPEGTRALSQAEAAALGYHVSLRGPRLTLRSSYSSPLSHYVKENGLDLEVVSATILYRLQGKVWAVDATIACTLNEATSDRSDLLWSVPHILSPLVRGRFTHRGVSIRVNGQALSEADVKEREYRISLQEGRVDVRIPIGAQGGRIKSGVWKGRYSQSMSVDLFFMYQWEDELWPLTQHRTFRLLKTPLVPQTPVLANYTVASEGVFSFTLGVFASDVSLQKVSVEGGGYPLTWKKSHQIESDAGLSVSRLSHANGSHVYRLHLPFSHSNIIPEYIGGGYKIYSLSLTFTLTISPHGEVFYHRATIESSVQEHRDAPTLEGKCTESGLLVILHYGAQEDLRWELFLGAHQLDWELVEMGGFRLEAEEEYFSVEIPLYSPGMTHEELTLQGLVARVEVSVVDVETLKLQDSLVHKCTFPVRELLACSPEGRMVAVVDTSHAIPPAQPNRTTLLDPSCVPTATDSARALFTFSLDSCGTTVTADGDFLVYENQVSYPRDFLPAVGDPLIHRDSPYRLTLRCRYPVNYSGSLSVHRPLNTTLSLSPTPQTQAKQHGGLHTGPQTELQD